MTPLRVFLLDDHAPVRRSIRAVLSDEDDLQVVGEASTADEALDRIPAARPDVALVGLRLGEGAATGIEACRDIRSAHPEVACVLLTSYADDDALLASAMADASGSLPTQARGNDLVGALRRVGAGARLLDPAMIGPLWDRLCDPSVTEDPRPGVGDRERRTLQLVIEGRTNRQIAGELGLEEATVKQCVSRLLRKLALAGCRTPRDQA